MQLARWNTESRVKKLAGGGLRTLIEESTDVNHSSDGTTITRKSKRGIHKSAHMFSYSYDDKRNRIFNPHVQ